MLSTIVFILYVAVGLFFIFGMGGLNLLSPPSRFVKQPSGAYHLKPYVPIWMWFIVLLVIWLPYLIGIILYLRYGKW